MNHPLPHPHAVAGAAPGTSHERQILERLAGIEGVPRLLDRPSGEVFIGDCGGELLAHVLAAGPLEVQALLDLSLRLARMLDAMHRRNVVHRDLNPANILLAGSGGAQLVGFQRASTFGQEQPGFTHHREIRGNPTYLAPEQTGRTGRSVDLRADLYALGATLYHAATGHPPFESADPLQKLHDVLARLPVSPSLLRADLPDALSRIILRLLEKEPERRYQSAEGLAHDLAQVRSAWARGDSGPMSLGEHDYPMQLSAPSRLVGREAEIEALRMALDEAVQGQARIVLLAGVPGVGKTSLIDELRPMVTERRGWFVSGKFDQYRHDAPAGMVQALRALGRLLLAEPESELVEQRERILRALGSNAGLICGWPEFALLLGPQPEVAAVDPAQAEARLLTTAVNLLRAVASSARPVVVALDDLQWTGVLPIRFVEAVLQAANLRGLLLVGSYRDAEIDAAHPLGAALDGWARRPDPPLQLRLANLQAADLGLLLRQMMRLSPPQAAALAQAVGEHTGGNPYDTVELLNALRRDGALRPGPDGWEWDATALRRYVGQRGVLDLLSARIARLPEPSRSLVHTMACLGGSVHRGLLCAATGWDAEALEEHLAAPLEDGLLVSESGKDGALRMRHDRVQQAAYDALEPARRRALHLDIARRLAATAEFGTAAVQHYLPVIDDIGEPAEIRSLAHLLRQVAVRHKAAADYASAQRLMAAALTLLSRLPAAGAADGSLRAALEIDHHVVLCTLGRFEEADVLYRTIESRGAPVEDWVDAACAQVVSLHNRSRPREAVLMGLPLLRRLGLAVPDDFAAADIAARLEHLAQWCLQVARGDDSRPYSGDTRSTAAARLITRLTYAAYFSSLETMAWLVSEAQVLWTLHGPSAELARSLSGVGGILVGLKQDYRTGHEGARHVRRVCEARGWELATAESRYRLASHGSHWFEPLEQGVRELQGVRDALLQCGELQNACFSHRLAATLLMDCAPTLQQWGEEMESVLALALRIRNDYAIAMLTIERQLLRGLRGEAVLPGSFEEDAQAAVRRQADQQVVRMISRFCDALSAGMLGDTPALIRHAQAAMQHVPRLTGYRGAQARMLQALALAQRIRAAAPGEREQVLAELGGLAEWMAQRADDAPSNYLHLATWIEAERAWALADFRHAARAFDAALCQVESVTRPWHHAMICERMGLFHLEHGMAMTGRQFIGRACSLYAAWGAKAKVRQMEAQHAFLAPASRPLAGIAAQEQEEAGAVDPIDTLAILRASQALSSETSLARLKSRVTELMGALTGATGMKFAFWDDDLRDWFLSDDQGGGETRISAAESRVLVPLSAFRYAERTREPLLVEDATADDRFARDPYLAGRTHCSLLVVPILNQGNLRAMLLLENTLNRSAFSSSRLEAVSLIAGQLAVSLENALLYDRLEQRVREQTEALRAAQDELVATARRAGMAEIATNVLHNVGNILTSVNVSASHARSKLHASNVQGLTRAVRLMDQHAGDLADFITQDERGKLLPQYLQKLSEALVQEQQEMLTLMDRLAINVDHIMGVVATQQSYAGSSNLLEPVQLRALVDDALRMNEDSLGHHQVVVAKELAEVPAIQLDKTRVMQVLVNLIRNAEQAMENNEGSPRRLTLRMECDDRNLRLRVSDTGCGIAAENLVRIFSHGFTTRKEGHGFGLHSCALAAAEMGGTLTAESDGAGRGATFTLELPIQPA